MRRTWPQAPVLDILDPQLGKLADASPCVGAQPRHPPLGRSPGVRRVPEGGTGAFASGTLRWYHTLGRQAKLFRFYRGYLNLGPPLVGRLRLGRAAVADRSATKHQGSSPLRLTEVDAPPPLPDRRARPAAPSPWLTACRRCIRRAQAGGLLEPPAGPPSPPLLDENARPEMTEATPRPARTAAPPVASTVAGAALPTP
jgi:hypothetical protein